VTWVCFVLTASAALSIGQARPSSAQQIDTIKIGDDAAARGLYSAAIDTYDRALSVCSTSERNNICPRVWIARADALRRRALQHKHMAPASVDTETDTDAQDDLGRALDSCDRAFACALGLPEQYDWYPAALEEKADCFAILARLISNGNFQAAKDLRSKALEIYELAIQTREKCAANGICKFESEADLALADGKALLRGAMALMDKASPSSLVLSSEAQHEFNAGLDSVTKHEFNVAVAHFEKARLLEPTDPSVRFNLALAESKIPGHEIRAIAWFESYLDAYPYATNSAQVEREIQFLHEKAKTTRESLLNWARQLATRDDQLKEIDNAETRESFGGFWDPDQSVNDSEMKLPDQKISILDWQKEGSSRWESFLESGQLNKPALVNLSNVVQEINAHPSNSDMVYRLTQAANDIAWALWSLEIQMNTASLIAVKQGALALEILGDVDGALRHYERAAHLDPRMRAQMGSVLTKAAKTSSQKQHYALAADELTLAIHFEPKEVNKLSLFFDRARAESQMREYTFAIEDYSETLERLRNTPNWQASETFRIGSYYRGEAYFYVGKYEDAIADFNTVIEKSADENLNAFYYRGLAYYLSARYDLAIVDLQKTMRWEAKIFLLLAKTRIGISLEVSKQILRQTKATGLGLGEDDDVGSDVLDMFAKDVPNAALFASMKEKAFRTRECRVSFYLGELAWLYDQKYLAELLFLNELRNNQCSSREEYAAARIDLKRLLAERAATTQP